MSMKMVNRRFNRHIQSPFFYVLQHDNIVDVHFLLVLSQNMSCNARHIIKREKKRLQRDTAKRKLYVVLDTRIYLIYPISTKVPKTLKSTIPKVCFSIMLDYDWFKKGKFIRSKTKKFARQAFIGENMH